MQFSLKQVPSNFNILQDEAEQKDPVEESEKAEVPENHNEEKEEEPTSPETYSTFQLFCDFLVRKLISKDPEGYFTNPVSR